MKLRMFTARDEAKLPTGPNLDQQQPNASYSTKQPKSFAALEVTSITG